MVIEISLFQIFAEIKEKMASTFGTYSFYH